MLASTTTTRRTRTPAIGSKDWHAQRRAAIFATDAAPAAGLSRFSDPVMLYLEKLGLTTHLLETERMKWGKLLERPIAMQWARDAGVRIRHESLTWYRDGLPFPMGSHLDYWVNDTELLEVKTASAYMVGDFGEEGTDQVPIDYRLQVVHELAVTGAERGHLVVLIGGQQLRKYVIERDVELEGSLLQIEHRLWDAVISRTPPEVDGGEGSRALLAMVDADAGLEIEVDGELAELADTYLGNKAAEKSIAEQLAKVGNLIRDRMGTATRARGGDLDILYRRSKDSSTINWQAVATELASDLAEANRTRFGATLATVPAHALLENATHGHITVTQGNRPLLVRHKEA